ncbi:Gfo/Idh/MocA family oxidoreductase [Danxiaibacter flavus]|uniref:Gfo/Idh/MocA family oxidoreductase n=1 Tax=Danxiaibacter flavus TaxID=3049108 RepID=A0ABV3Z9R2_9BACT|nr:Gfo/Idh/MocA family oxidoreductase [Chitinophagaceae bacterium DXS]
MQIINTALCSFGMSGKVFHAPFIDLHPGFKLTGAWERSKKLIQEAYPGVKSYTSLEEILEDETVDLVVVNTPNVTHYDYTKKALLAGKNVVVEKPFTNTIAEAEELKELSVKQNKLLSVYHNRRYDSDFSLVRQVVHDKLLGDIVEAEIHFDRFNKQLSPKAHKEVPGIGTGVLYDLGAHLIDQALQLFSFPEAVFADIRTLRPESQVDDYFEVLLYYPSLRVRVKSSYIVKEPLPAYSLHGTKGSFLKSRADVQEADLIAGKKPSYSGWGIEPASEEGLLHAEKNGTDIKEKLAAPAGNYVGYYDDLYKAFTSGKPVPVTADDGIRIIKIIEAAFKSNNERKVIDLTE